MNVASHSVGKPFFDPTLGRAVGTASNRTGGPSTIVVMMNNNSNRGQSNTEKHQKDSASYLTENESQDYRIRKKFFQQYSKSAENDTGPKKDKSISVNEKQIIKTESR